MSSGQASAGRDNADGGQERHLGHARREAEAGSGVVPIVSLGDGEGLRRGPAGRIRLVYQPDRLCGAWIPGSHTDTEGGPSGGGEQGTERREAVTQEELESELTVARLAVNDWHGCASQDELDRWRKAQHRFIDAAKAVGAAALSAKLEEHTTASTEAIEYWRNQTRLIQARRDELQAKLEKELLERQKWSDHANAVNDKLDAENEALKAKLEEVQAALSLTQLTVSGSFEAGWTIQVTGYEMEAIRAALGAEASRGEVVKVQENDESRWATIEQALRSPDLSDSVRLLAIGSIVQSRKPLTEKEIARGQELAEILGWQKAERGEVVKACPHLWNWGNEETIQCSRCGLLRNRDESKP